MALLSHKKWLHRHLSSGLSEDLEPKVGDKRSASNGNGFAKLSAQEADLRSQPLRKRVLSDVRDDENGEGRKFYSCADASLGEPHKAWESSSWATYGFKHGSAGNSPNVGSARTSAKPRENGNGLEDDGNRSSKSLSNLASPQSNAESGRGWRRGETAAWGPDDGEGMPAAGVEPPGADILDKIDVVSLPAVGNYSAYRQFPYFRRVCSAFAGSSSRVTSRAESSAKSWTVGDLLQLVAELRRMGRESRERRALLMDGVALLDGGMATTGNNNNNDLNNCNNNSGGAGVIDGAGKTAGSAGKGKRRVVEEADMDEDEGDDNVSTQDGAPSLSGLMSPGSLAGDGAEGGLFSPTSSVRAHRRKGERSEGGEGDAGPGGGDNLGDGGYSDRLSSKDRKGPKGEPGYGAKPAVAGPGGFPPGSLVSPGRKVRASAPGSNVRVDRRKDWHSNDALKDFESGRGVGRKDGAPPQKQAQRTDLEGPHRLMPRREAKEPAPLLASGGREGKLSQDAGLMVCRPSAESAHLDKPLAPPASRYGSLEPARDIKREDASGSRVAAAMDAPLAPGVAPSGLDVLASTLAEASGEDYEEEDPRGANVGYGGGGGHKWDGMPWGGTPAGRSSLDRQGAWSSKAGKRWRSERPPLPPLDPSARAGSGDGRGLLAGDGRRGGVDERGMGGDIRQSSGRSAHGSAPVTVASGSGHLGHHGEEQHRQRRREGNSYVCAACESTGELVLCGGPCLRAFHRGCLHPSELERIACLGAGTTSPNTPPSSTGPMAGHAIPPHMLLGTGAGGGASGQAGGEEGEVGHEGGDDMHAAGGEDGGANAAAGDAWGGNAASGGNAGGGALTSWRCADCRQQVHECFQCKVAGPDRLLRRCSGVACGKYYHESCLARLRLTKYDGPNRFYCPLHACERCGDSGRSKQSTRCVRCPTAYHLKCLPLQQPRCHQVTRHRIICSKHGPYNKDAPRQMMPPPLEEPLSQEVDAELEEDAVEEHNREEEHLDGHMWNAGHVFGAGGVRRDGLGVGERDEGLQEAKEVEDGDDMGVDVRDGEGRRRARIYAEGRVKPEPRSVGRESLGEAGRYQPEATERVERAGKRFQWEEEGGGVKEEDSYEEGEARGSSDASGMESKEGVASWKRDAEVSLPSNTRGMPPDRHVELSQVPSVSAPAEAACGASPVAKRVRTSMGETRPLQEQQGVASPLDNLVRSSSCGQAEGDQQIGHQHGSAAAAVTASLSDGHEQEPEAATLPSSTQAEAGGCVLPCVDIHAAGAGVSGTDATPAAAVEDGQRHDTQPAAGKGEEPAAEDGGSLKGMAGQQGRRDEEVGEDKAMDAGDAEGQMGVQQAPARVLEGDATWGHQGDNGAEPPREPLESVQAKVEAAPPTRENATADARLLAGVASRGGPRSPKEGPIAMGDEPLTGRCLQAREEAGKGTGFLVTDSPCEDPCVAAGSGDGPRSMDVDEDRGAVVEPTPSLGAPACLDAPMEVDGAEPTIAAAPLVTVREPEVEAALDVAHEAASVVPSSVSEPQVGHAAEPREGGAQEADVTQGAAAVASDAGVSAASADERHPVGVVKAGSLPPAPTLPILHQPADSIAPVVGTTEGAAFSATWSDPGKAPMPLAEQGEDVASGKGVECKGADGGIRGITAVAAPSLEKELLSVPPAAREVAAVGADPSKARSNAIAVSSLVASVDEEVVMADVAAAGEAQESATAKACACQPCAGTELAPPSHSLADMSTTEARCADGSVPWVEGACSPASAPGNVGDALSVDAGSTALEAVSATTLSVTKEPVDGDVDMARCHDGASKQASPSGASALASAGDAASRDGPVPTTAEGSAMQVADLDNAGVKRAAPGAGNQDGDRQHKAPPADAALGSHAPSAEMEG